MGHGRNKADTDLRSGNQNAFLVKRKQAGGVQLSRDPLNLTNKHSRKYAGFVNDKAIGINPDSPNTIGLTTKVASKGNKVSFFLPFPVTRSHSSSTNSSLKPASNLHITSFSSNTPSRKIYKSVVNSTVKKGYRSDLRAEAVARASAVKQSQQDKKERKSGSAPRGVKAKKAAEKSESS